MPLLPPVTSAILRSDMGGRCGGGDGDSGLCCVYMATFIKLAEDVAKVIEAEMERHPGMTEEELVNDLVRHAIPVKQPAERKPFVVRSFHMGLKPGLNHDDVWGLLDQVDGPGSR